MATKRTVEVEIFGAGAVPMFRVAGYAGFGELWLYPAEDGALLSVHVCRGFGGCHVPARAPAGWPPLEAIVREALA